ncbi:MAG TPA: Hpt domain-containing protein [Phycisphaerae bacterium]|nr:Hpt domain-containing protein [Phycisphaerae bacterium]
MPHRSIFANEQSMRPLLAEYAAGLRAHVAALRADLARAAWNDLRLRLHQLKGSGASYGFAEITDYAAAAEQRLLARDFPAATDAIDRLIGYMEGVEGYGTPPPPSPSL